MPNSELVQSLLRGLDILKLISSKPEGMRLNELVDATGLKKSTIHNLLRTLAARGFVVKDPLNRFAVGPAVLEMAHTLHTGSIGKKLESELLRLAEVFPGHTLTVSTLTGSRIKCLMRVSPDLPGMIQKPADQFFMPYVSVTAIALQAANPELGAELEKRFPFEEFGIGKWGTPEKFNACKAEVLKKGSCCQETGDQTAAAFIMPDAMVMGISVRGSCVQAFEKYKSAAAELRRTVWEKEEKK